MKLFLQAKEDNDESWAYDFRPSLYVDFDSRKLFSLYSEPASYEDFVPNKWVGEFFDFLNLVPESEKYWVEESYRSL